MATSNLNDNFTTDIGILLNNILHNEKTMKLTGTYNNALKEKLTKAVISKIRILQIEDTELPTKITNSIMKLLNYKPRESLLLPLKTTPNIIIYNITHHSRKIAYMDIEGTSTRPLECAILIIANGRYLNHLHIFGAYQDKDHNGATFCHGIKRIKNAVKPETLYKTTIEFLNNMEPEKIYANGMTDIKEFLNGEWSEKCTELTLPGWEKRGATLAQQSILLKKIELGGLSGGHTCDKGKHHGHFQGSTKANTIGQQAKKLHGVHCAWDDAVELAIFDVLRETRTHDQSVNTA
jgi:hypothetical protein